MSRILDALRRALDSRSDDSARSFPLIVPSRYSDFFVLAPLPTQDLFLTAVFMKDDQTMKYLTHENVTEFERKGVDWKELAMRNLLANKEYPLTQGKEREDGGLVYVVMMTQDGLGTSRIFCREELLERFPEGYWLAIPERSVGVAVSKAVGAEELEDVKGMIQHLFEIGTSPGSPLLFKPEKLGG